jgi:uncharacterized phage protein (TIGR02218 family)
MIAATPQLASFMDGARAAVRVDLYTLTLATGTVLRWCAADAPLALPDGRSFTTGPLITRSKLALVAGIQVDEMAVAITPRASDLVAGVPLLRLARVGGLRGCEVLLEWAYLTTAGVLQGVLPKFAGRASPTGYDGSTIHLAVKSELERLMVQMPRDVYQATCLNTLYDAGCGKARAAYTVTASVVSASSASAFTTGLTQPAGHFEQGVLRFTAGLNAGVGRTVRSYAGGAFSFALPFPFAISPGDAFAVYPGCDGELATCSGKFNNRARFRGQPFIPAPEVAT